MSDLCRLIWCALIGLFRSRVALEAEILVLRHQLNVLRRKSPKRLAKTDEYRQFANDCIVWARIATSDDQREQFLELAKKWMSDAESIDQGIELRPKEAVNSVARMLTPVMLLPGLARLAASPESTRSSPTHTMGSVLVATCAARPASSPY